MTHQRLYSLRFPTRHLRRVTAERHGRGDARDIPQRVVRKQLFVIVLSMTHIVVFAALLLLGVHDTCRADHKPGHQTGGGGGGGGSNPGGNGGGAIYFSYDGRPYTMNDDGSGVTELENFPTSFRAERDSEPSRDRHADKRWFSQIGGRGFVALSDAGNIVSLDIPSNISLQQPRWGVGDQFLSWVGQRWDDDSTSASYGAVVEGGLYTIGLDFDGQGNIQGTVGSPRLLVPFPLVECPAVMSCPDVVAPDIKSHDWSPDGDQFVYDTLVDRELRTYDLTTSSEATILSDGESWSPRWSPAGDQIMLSHRSGRRRPGIWVVGVDGSGMTQVQTDTATQHPHVGAWSPTGSHLIYLSDDAFNVDSYIVRATSAGKSKVSLTDEDFASGFNTLWPLGWRAASVAVAVPEPGYSLGLIICVAVAMIRGFRRRSALAACLLLVTLVSISVTHAAEFIPLGFPPGADSSMVDGMSPDGAFVLGTYNSSFPQPFRWSEAGGFESLGSLPADFTLATPYDASLSGDVIVGTLRNTNGDMQEAFRWTISGGIQPLGIPPGMTRTQATAVSADGSTIIGASRNDDLSSVRGFLWQEATGIADLRILPSGARFGAGGISADGSVVVGVRFPDGGTQVIPRESFRWTASNGVHPLAPLPGDNNTVSEGVSADGSFVVGDSTFEDNGTGVSRRAVRWAADGQPQLLGELPAGSWSVALDASADGSTVIGMRYVNGAPDAEPFVWTETAGMQSLQDVFLLNGLSASDWRRMWVFNGAISDDGLTIAGTGFNAHNRREGWIAHLDVIPEPSAWTLLLVGLVGLRKKRRQACA